MNCKNCGEIVNGNFCANCGQSTTVDKITFSNFLEELSASIFQINRGIIYSSKELFIRPGHSIREYLGGKRKDHFKPIAFAFTLSTVYFLLSKYGESSTVINDFLVGWSGVSDDFNDNQLVVLDWFARNYAYTMLLLIPLYSLASYLSFRKAGFNYLEHFVLNAYITGQQAVFYSLAAILGLFTSYDETLNSILAIISIIYTVFVFRQFFSDRSRTAVMLRLLLTYFLYLIMITIVIFTLSMTLG
jgi:hypothetical protein